MHTREMLSYALVSRQGKSLKKSSFTEQKRKKIHITADTAHLLNRMGACACFSIEHLECVHVWLCVCECVLRLWAGMDAILLHFWTSGAGIRAQAHSRRLIGQWQHGPAHCTFLETVGSVRHLAELKTEKRNQCELWILKEHRNMNGFTVEYVFTHPRAREISSSWVLCSGCPFSAGLILYCWTSWGTWFSWFWHGQNMLSC